MLDGKSIQVEDGGYTRVHNTILELLSKARLSSLELRIVLFVIRKTYGFQKTMDIISITQFEECGASRRKTIQAVQNLIRLKVLIREPAGQSFRYGFNKYAENWLPETFQSRHAGNGKRFHKAPKTTSDLTDTSDPTDTSTSDPRDTKTSDPRDTHKRKKEIKRNLPQKTRGALFVTLARVCRVDKELKRGQLNKTAKSLDDAGYTAEDLDIFEKWWVENDFRGQRGNPPTLPQVVNHILQAKQESESARPPPKQYEPFWENGELKYREIKA